MPLCHAHNRDGSPCEAEAVPGWPVCSRHGAGNPAQDRPRGRPRTHGAYARTVRPDEEETLNELRSLGFGLQEEVALARLQLTRALQRSLDENTEECDGKHCPFALVDSRLSLVSRVAMRSRRIMEGLSIRLVDDEQIDEIVQIIARHVTDEPTRAAIAAELKEVGR